MIKVYVHIPGCIPVCSGVHDMYLPIEDRGPCDGVFFNHVLPYFMKQHLLTKPGTLKILLYWLASSGDLSSSSSSPRLHTDTDMPDFL